MLRLENITFSYDDETEALKDITLNIEKGKKTLFLGENGSGKSTLFLIMNGLLKAQNLGYSKEKVEESVNRAMKEINIENLKDRPCHHLSYGQKKRVSIAAITAMEPELLILDEPTAWLDSKNTKRVSEILDNFSKAGKTMVVSTHDTDFAYEFADYIYVLEKGEIVRQGSRDEVFEDFEFLKKLNLNIPNVLKIKSYLKYKNLDESDYYKFLEEKNLL